MKQDGEPSPPLVVVASADATSTEKENKTTAAACRTTASQTNAAGRQQEEEESVNIKKEGGPQTTKWEAKQRANNGADGCATAPKMENPNNGHGEFDRAKQKAPMVDPSGEFDILDVVVARAQASGSNNVGSNQAVVTNDEADDKYKEKEARKRAATTTTTTTTTSLGPTTRTTTTASVAGLSKQPATNGVQPPPPPPPPASSSSHESLEKKIHPSIDMGDNNNDLDISDVILKRSQMVNHEEDNNNAQAALARSTSSSQPGAYSGCPGEGLQRREDVRFSLVGKTLPGTDETFDQITTTGVSTDDVVVGRGEQLKEEHHRASDIIPSAANNNEDQQASHSLAVMDGSNNSMLLLSGSLKDYSETTTIVAAEVVDDDLSSENFRLKEAKMEESIRQRIMNEAVMAVVTEEKEDHFGDGGRKQQQQRRYRTWLIILVVVIIIVGVVIAAILGTQLSSNSDDDDSGKESSATTDPTPPTDDVSPSSSAVNVPHHSPTQTPTTILIDRTQPTIDTIRDRGFIRCGIIFQSNGVNASDLESINIEQCRALSIAVLGSPDTIEITKLGSNRKEALAFLANHTVDVLTALTTRSMLRDVFEPYPQSSFTFTTPYVYIGGVFAGVPKFVDCAENLDGMSGDCRDLKVCTFGGTTYEGLLRDQILRGVEIVLSDKMSDIGRNLDEGVCNVAFADRILIPQSIEGERGGNNESSPDYKLGSIYFSRDNCGCTTRDDDPEWANLVKLVLDAFYTAEAASISKSNAEELFSYLPNNQEMAEMLVSIISQLGNYGDIYSKGMVNLLPRQGLNSLYNERHNGTGLLFSFPFGSVDNEYGPEPANTMKRIIDRNELLCGVRPRPGFATIEEDFSTNSSRWVGFDVEFCRAVAAALLRDGVNKVTFVNASAASEQYELLTKNEVDLVAGARVTLEAGYNETSTGKAYTFSLPYYYEGRDAYALMTRDNDPQWSDFVFWVVNGLIYAEEHGITQSNSTEMPVVFVFGNKLKQMFRDCLATVGSYADIYSRTLGGMIPRSPPNTLNDGLSPQQFPIPFS